MSGWRKVSAISYERGAGPFVLTVDVDTDLYEENGHITWLWALMYPSS
jgi:hypothetical protein